MLYAFDLKEISSASSIIDVPLHYTLLYVASFADFFLKAIAVFHIYYMLYVCLYKMAIYFFVQNTLKSGIISH